jgi:L-iditol 2-dehydrogenase
MDIPTPEIKPGYIETKVKSCAICGSDLHMWETGSPRIAMGHEFSAEVTNPGDSEFKEGDRVVFSCGIPCYQCDMCLKGKRHLCRSLWQDDYTGISIDGGLAEKYIGLAKYAYKLPDCINFQAAAMVEPLSVAYHAINQAHMKLGAKVLVVGGGVIGQLIGALARRAGAVYTALSEINAQRMNSAKKIGDFNEYFDAADQDQVAKLMGATGGGFDVVFECSAVQGGYMTSFLAAKPDSVVILVGAPSGFISVLPILVVSKELHVSGTIACSFQEYHETIDLIANGFDPLPYVSAVAPLKDTQKCFEQLTSGTDPAIKIIIEP